MKSTQKSKLDRLIEGMVKKVLKEETWPKGSVPTSSDFKKGDKVKTRDGDIETVLKINSDGNIETVENDYSWPPYTLKLVKRNGKSVTYNKYM